MASIIVTSGGQKGEFLPLGRQTNVIGRAETLPLQVLDDLVSQKHLRICFAGTADTYYAQDLNSKHGVFINNRRITDETALAEGDETLIGNTTLLFTKKDFDDRESALARYKQVGERQRPTRDE